MILYDMCVVEIIVFGDVDVLNLISWFVFVVGYGQILICLVWVGVNCFDVL